MNNIYEKVVGLNCHLVVVRTLWNGDSFGENICPLPIKNKFQIQF